MRATPQHIPAPPAAILRNVWMASIRNPDYKALSSMDTYWNNTLDLFASWTTKLFCILLVCDLFCLMIFS
ncbi:hypothetical protein KUCAC02_000578 [Chaenocephalus aceratus]|uniref:Uncharacterized protein n=1 Tax=Chaenocephalus aceratus TaxID=36190 RepID=A0ACB9W6P0_CHAAC|nr:hypothetical protein KUCAC02_000578 [Chaenocephalus aceratus]